MANHSKTILVLASSPTNEARLRLDTEMREIDEGLRRSQHRDKFTLRSKFAVRPDDLRRALLDFKPQIVHFCGHGSGENGLMLEDDAGLAQLVSTQALVNLCKRFAARGLECVVLNACYSEVQANAIAEHIDYVVGMNSTIGDDAAIKFAIGFYDELGAGYSYEDAYHGGCDAIALQGIPEENTPIFKNLKKVQLTAINREIELMTWYNRYVPASTTPSKVYTRQCRCGESIIGFPWAICLSMSIFWSPSVVTAGQNWMIYGRILRSVNPTTAVWIALVWVINSSAFPG